ncbi:hypothetical protein Acr_05g0005250 [Actinidia rufa]|uniref:Uncharacterized protein n=1 Tax=Actinidia rufa TaxID=165716 RepID=A0A7J0EKZ0_9ERIC|nr:hypothetical protein Acr_05g0005250 [Actinidia rufa]
MARGKSLCTCAFLLVLILSYGIMHCEGRKMKAKSGKVSGGGGSGGGGSFVVESEENSPVGPGHSPGVGHSVGPTSAGPLV